MNERTSEVLAEAKAIVAALEEGSLSVNRVALRARRLAQTIDDDAAFMWLNLEINGAPGATAPERKWNDPGRAQAGLDKFVAIRAVEDYSKLTGEALRRKAESGEVPDRPRAMGAPLAPLEARSEMSKEEEAMLLREPGGLDSVLLIRKMEQDRRAVIARVEAAIHEFAANIYVVYRFRRAAAHIFDRVKTSLETILTGISVDAISKLTHAIDRAASDSPEDWSAAALACRRVLKDFADSVYPPRSEKVDGRDVGDEAYKNRLWAYAKEHGQQKIEAQFLALEEIEGLCKALDRMYELDSKGVHANITRAEADMMILRTYILLSQLAELAPSRRPDA